MQDKYKANVYMLPFLTQDEKYDAENSYIYFMFSGDGNTLLYVGQTDNLKRRITSHYGKLCEMSMMLQNNSLSDVKYKVIKVDHQDLNMVEKYYIKRYCPPRNKTHNSPDVIRAYELWYYENLLIAYNKNRASVGEKPLAFEEAYGNKMQEVI